MSRRALLNLSSRPFRNDRPFRRLFWTVWLVGGALFVYNVVAFGLYFRGSTGGREDLDAAMVELEQVQAGVRATADEIAGFDFRRQNSRARFLNDLIEQRAFPWSELFDRIGEVLPYNVRLLSLTPRAADRADREGRRPFTLQIRGEAQTSEALLDFLDALFEHPAFEQPKLRDEGRQENRTIAFTLSTVYFKDLTSTPDGGGETRELTSAQSVDPECVGEDCVAPQEPLSPLSSSDAVVEVGAAPGAEAGVAPRLGEPTTGVDIQPGQASRDSFDPTAGRREDTAMDDAGTAGSPTARPVAGSSSSLGDRGRPSRGVATTRPPAISPNRPGERPGTRSPRVDPLDTRPVPSSPNASSPPGFE